MRHTEKTTVEMGVSPTGEPVREVRLGSGALTARIWTYGACLHDLRISGCDHPLLVAPTEPAGHVGPLTFAGVIVGPVANRIKGAEVEIEGTRYSLCPNEASGNVVHCGAEGLHVRNWEIAEQSDSHVLLRCVLADGQDGLPGDRQFEVKYTLVDDNSIRLDFTATCNKVTPVNLAHHPFWNLDASKTVDRHALWIGADTVLPTDEALIPTGEELPVAGTQFDFRDMRVIGPATRIDNNFVLGHENAPLREVARLHGATGVMLSIETTEPGLQIYNGFAIPETDLPLTNGQKMGPRSGIAIEPQHWPDAPGRSNFPDILLRPGETYRQTTLYRLNLKAPTKET